MTHFFKASLITITTTMALLSTTISAQDLVEIRLVDDIDDSRGYCLDVAGGQGVNAPIESGLQAHTCYDYTGGLLEDQSFDAERIEQGQFNITYFDVCMVASPIATGSSLMLETCENVDTQLFSLQDNGNLIMQANPELCVTASSTEKREGRGGSPAHVMRPVTLQTCSDASSAYQTWTTFSL